VNNNVFDIYIVAGVGAFGYLLSVLKFDAPPLLLGFVLGPMVEENLRRALLLSRGDMMTFVERPISAWLLAAGGALILFSVWGAIKGIMRDRERARDMVEI
ncbi:MAG: TctA family transporter, partial [Rhodoferax sp.]